VNNAGVGILGLKVLSRRFTAELSGPFVSRR
jgi:hypothetical protein